jgi:hypothetical protein
MILRFSTRSSNALVLVPNIREKVGLDTFAGIWGSEDIITRLTQNPDEVGKLTFEPVDNLQPLRLLSRYIRLAESIFSLHEFRFPTLYPGFLPDLIKVPPNCLHVWNNIRLETFFIECERAREYEQVTLQICHGNTARNISIGVLVKCLSDKVEDTLVLKVIEPEKAK